MEDSGYGYSFLGERESYTIRKGDDSYAKI